MRHDLIAWASREVEVQGDTYEDVAPLIRSYLYLEKRLAGDRRLSGMNVHTLMQAGHLAKPDLNPTTRFRDVLVYIGNGVVVTHEFPHWRDVPRLIDQLCEAWVEERIDTTKWFIEFEEIHPYADGNGRTGAAITNILQGNADDELLLSYEIHSFD